MKNAVAMLQQVLLPLWLRVVVREVNSAFACQQVDISLVAGETKNRMEYLKPYCLTGLPQQRMLA